jgi:hypothetical protein
VLSGHINIVNIVNNHTLIACPVARNSGKSLDERFDLERPILLTATNIRPA